MTRAKTPGVGKGVILIPARAGSTRVPGKNLKLLGGKPLLGHIVEAAVSANCGRVIVSTDCDDIAAVAESFGAEVPFRRPLELATATATSVGVLLHALRWFQDIEDGVPDLIAFCPPTSPFTRVQTIFGMMDTLITDEIGRFNSIVTISEINLHPFGFVQVLDDSSLKIDAITVDGKNANNVERSQDLPAFRLRTANCAVTRVRYFTEIYGKTLREEAGDCIQTFDPNRCMGWEILLQETQDIDNEADFEAAENMLSRQTRTVQ